MWHRNLVDISLSDKPHGYWELVAMHLQIEMSTTAQHSSAASRCLQCSRTSVTS